MLIALSIDLEQLVVKKIVPLNSLLRVELQQLNNQSFAARAYRNVGRELHLVARLNLYFVFQLVIVLGLERSLPKQQLEKDDTNGPQVCLVGIGGLFVHD